MCNIRKCHDKTVLTSVITDHTLGPVYWHAIVTSVVLLPSMQKRDALPSASFHSMT